MIDQKQLSQTDKDTYEDLIRKLNEENTILNDQVLQSRSQGDSRMLASIDRMLDDLTTFDKQLYEYRIQQLKILLQVEAERRVYFEGEVERLKRTLEVERNRSH